MWVLAMVLGLVLVAIGVAVGRRRSYRAADPDDGAGSPATRPGA
jgi:hypothetical protein